jgi:hypothetical protein
VLTITALGYEYKPNGILLTIIYDLDGESRIVRKFYEGAAEINFDWEEEAHEIIKKNLGLEH